MNLRAEVYSISDHDSLFAKSKMRKVTLRLWNNFDQDVARLTMVMTEHESRAYTIGRWVTINIVLDPPKKKEKKAQKQTTKKKRVGAMIK